MNVTLYERVKFSYAHKKAEAIEMIRHYSNLENLKNLAQNNFKITGTRRVI